MIENHLGIEKWKYWGMSVGNYIYVYIHSKKKKKKYNHLYWNSCRFCFITVSSLPVRPSSLWSEYFFHHWYSTFFLYASVLVLVFAAVTLECPCIELTMFILRAFLWSQLCRAKHLEYIGWIGISCVYTLLLCSRVYCRNRIIKNNSAWLHCCLFSELRGTPGG